MRTALPALAALWCAAVLVSACSGSDDESSPGSGSSQAMGIRPLYAPQYLCGMPGSITNEVMSDLNRFWQSSVQACSCQPDAPGICYGGAFVGIDPGYIYYDAQAMTRLDQITGSRLPADMVMAHEFGHSIQLWTSLRPAGKFLELQADCLAGFYVGSRIRRGLATQADVSSSFATACSYGDPYLAPWYEPGSHGVCQERVAMLNQGITGSLSGATYRQVCG